jgi:hypothetical protein
MDLQLLLPRTSTPTDLGMFVTNIPMFKHIVGNLSHFFFEHFKIVDPASSITVGVRTPESSHGQGYIEPHTSVSSPFPRHRYWFRRQALKSQGVLAPLTNFT